MNPLSFEVVLEGEETLLAGLGVKNMFRFLEYYSGIVYTLSCKIHAAFLAISSTLKVHSMDFSSNVGGFGFCRL